MNFCLNSLPNEMICYTFSFLNPKSLGSAAQVCSHWNRLIDDIIWKNVLSKTANMSFYINLAEYELRATQIENKTLVKKLDCEAILVKVRDVSMPRFFWNDWKEGFSKTLSYLTGRERFKRVDTFSPKMVLDHPSATIQDMQGHAIRVSGPLYPFKVLSIAYKKDIPGADEKVITIFERYPFKTHGITENTTLVCCGDLLPRTREVVILEGKITSPSFFKAIKALIHKGELMWFPNEKIGIKNCRYILVN